MVRISAVRNARVFFLSVLLVLFGSVSKGNAEYVISVCENYMDFAPCVPAAKELRIYSAIGQYESAAFSIKNTGLKDEEILINISDLVTGKGDKIESKSFNLKKFGMFIAPSKDEGNDAGLYNDYSHFEKMFLLKTTKIKIKPDSVKYFWLTLKTSPEVKPGEYTGKLTIVPKDGTGGSAEIKMVAVIYPFTLIEPALSYGWDYCCREGAQLEIDLKDMREHGATTVGLLYDLPAFPAGLQKFEEFLKMYRKYKYPGILRCAAPMTWQTKEAIDSIKSALDVAKKYGFTEKDICFSVCDELTNRGLSAINKGVARAKEIKAAVPAAMLSSDMNGNIELMSFSRILNICSFNNGWVGAGSHNKNVSRPNAHGAKYSLINSYIIKEVIKAGSTPWFVNGGRSRFNFGYFFWKMSKFGVKGKSEWLYNGTPQPGWTCYTRYQEAGLEEDIAPYLHLEVSREGIDDMKYLFTLEKAVEEGKKKGVAADKIKAAEGLLDKIGKSIIEDKNYYDVEKKYWSPGQFDKVRRDVAEMIIKLQ